MGPSLDRGDNSSVAKGNRLKTKDNDEAPKATKAAQNIGDNKLDTEHNSVDSKSNIPYHINKHREILSIYW